MKVTRRTFLQKGAVAGASLSTLCFTLAMAFVIICLAATNAEGRHAPFDLDFQALTRFGEYMTP